MLGVTEVQLLEKGVNEGTMRIELPLGTGVKKEKEAWSTYLSLSVCWWGEEGVETRVLQEVGGQACEAIPGVEGSLNEPMRKKESGLREN